MTSGLQETRSLFNPLRSVGVDWVTATFKSPVCESMWDSMCADLLSGEFQAGNFCKPWSMKGYEGLQCGPIKTGTRPDGAIVIATGAGAHLNWARILPYADNCSRIDLQVTYKSQVEPLREIRNQRRFARRAPRKPGRSPEVWWRESTTRGLTLYIGSRQSLKFGRVYDKGFQSKLPEFQGCVRMETQFANDAACYVMRKLLSSHTRENTIGSTVVSYFKNVGCRPPGEIARQFQLKPLDAFKCSRALPEAQASLEWLRTQVTPTVRRLIDYGYFESVCEVLGISAHMDQQPISQEDRDDS